VFPTGQIITPPKTSYLLCKHGGMQQQDKQAKPQSPRKNRKPRKPVEITIEYHAVDCDSEEAQRRINHAYDIIFEATLRMMALSDDKSHPKD